MPHSQSKNNNDLAMFTYDEKPKLGHGAQKLRVGKDSIKPFDHCCLCLKPFVYLMCCLNGHTFCKLCILKSLLAQIKHNQRKKQEKEEAEEKLLKQEGREVDAFDEQNHGDAHNSHSSCTFCPEGHEKLKLESLFRLHFAEEKTEKKKSGSYVCPSCEVSVPNTKSLVALRRCGHVFCKNCAHNFMAVHKFCFVCHKGCKRRHFVKLQKRGTRFAAHGDSP